MKPSPLLPVLLLGGLATAGASDALGAFSPRGAPELAALAQRGRGGTPPPPERGGDQGKRRRGDGPDLAERYFRMCDQDGDGFISFYEARSTLELDRSEFAVYDRDVDGLIDPTEFRARYDAITSAGGVFKPPKVAAEQEDARRRERSLELIADFDLDENQVLDAEELDEILDAHSLEDTDLELLLENVDVDGSGSLDLGEVGRLLPLLSREVDPTQYMRAQARTIVDLFGEPEEREGGPDWAPEPPYIRGPVPSFYRLDIDRDGLVREDDLKHLLRPLKLSVRIHTIVAFLDRDGDGGLSAEEIRRSMRRP